MNAQCLNLASHLVYNHASSYQNPSQFTCSLLIHEEETTMLIKYYVRLILPRFPASLERLVCL